MSSSMRMRQSLDEIEEALAAQAAADRLRAQTIRRQAEKRTRRRHLDRTHKRGTWRFFGLVLMLVATAVLVTVAMFQTLYVVMG